jgi:hypothetical protein
MARYAFHDLTLEVAAVADDAAADLDRILKELFWEAVDESSTPSDVSLSVLGDEQELAIPREARETFRADDFRGLEHRGEFFLTDGETQFRLEPRSGRGTVRLGPSFFDKPLLFRQNFWVFALLKMLRPSGVFGLHAAGLIAEDGAGVLVVGPSGSGKSTLAIGLVRSGWRYLSDDAVLLRSGSEGVEALALRRHFYVVDSEAADYADLSLGEERSDSCGGRRRRVGVEAAFASQRAGSCVPRTLLFAILSGEARSVLRPLDRAKALGRLMGESSPQLFDSGTMEPHVAILKRLVQQAEAYELSAGLDLREDPAGLSRLLAMAREERPCLASS